jgi:hypothetical protein
MTLPSTNFPCDPIGWVAAPSANANPAPATAIEPAATAAAASLVMVSLVFAAVIFTCRALLVIFFDLRIPRRDGHARRS